MNIGPTEIIVVLIIALLVFGPKRLPQMGKSLGKGVREFKKAADTAKTELGLGEVTDQINDVKSTFTDPIKDVKGSIGDLKSSVDLKSAIEAPAPAKDAAVTGAVAAAGFAGASAPSPETPDVAPDVAPEAPAAPEAPDAAVTAGAAATGGTPTGA